MSCLPAASVERRPCGQSLLRLPRRGAAAAADVDETSGGTTPATPASRRRSRSRKLASCLDAVRSLTGRSSTHSFHRPRLIRRVLWLRPAVLAVSLGDAEQTHSSEGRLMQSFNRLGLGVAAVLCFLSRGGAEDWPQFRGPNCSGVAASSKPLPTNFSFKDQFRWSVTLCEGIASPIVAGGRVFATAMTGSQKFAIACLDGLSGKVLWKRELDTGPLPKITPPNSYASSTPATDGDRVYVYFS